MQVAKCSFVFQDIEALCLYIENIGIPIENQRVNSLIRSSVYMMKLIFGKCNKLDPHRTNKLLGRFLTGIKNVCQEGSKTITEFCLATSYLNLVIIPSEFQIAEKFKRKDVVSLLFLRAYEASWSSIGFATFTTLYMRAIESGYGATLPTFSEFFTKGYENLTRLEKDVNSTPVLIFRHFVREIYNRCSGYNEGPAYYLDKVFFMKILSEIARLTSPYDEVVIEDLVAGFSKKEEVLADWKSWKDSNSINL